MGVISDVIVVIRERYKANTKMLEKTIKDWKVYAEDGCRVVVSGPEANYPHPA